MIRNILSIIIGLVTAVITFVIVESVNSSLHPIPANLDFKNTEVVKQFYDNQPISFWLMVIFGWVVGSLLCGFLIKLISKSDKKILTIIAGVILTLSAVANFYLLPHPTWFIIVGVLIFIPTTLLGHSLYLLKTHGN